MSLETKHVPATKETIPWPVKSGRFADLTESTVKDFFLNACPDADSPARMCNVSKAGCLRWHPDKAAGLFPVFIESLAEREVLRMISRVVTELMLKEKEKRRATPA